MYRRSTTGLRDRADEVLGNAAALVLDILGNCRQAEVLSHRVTVEADHGDVLGNVQAYPPQGSDHS
jgi:hypothetical protein